MMTMFGLGLEAADTQKMRRVSRWSRQVLPGVVRRKEEGGSPWRKGKENDAAELHSQVTPLLTGFNLRDGPRFRQSGW